jgi:tetratricopeptide (TPR) repeat protein
MKRAPSLLLLSLAALVVSAPASAQDAAVEAEVEAPADPATEEAMTRFADANALFERGDHRGALAEMLRVYELLEGSENQYIVLFNLARVYEELHRYDLAVETYERYLASSPADAPDRSDVEAILRALERLLGSSVISVDVDEAEVWIGEWQVGVAPGEIRVPSGVHQIELRAPGHETVRRQIEVAARESVAVEAHLPLLSDFHGLDPAIFVTTTVLAVIGLGVGAGLGGAALAANADATACGDRPGCMLDIGARRHEIADLALGADVAFGIAGLFAVTSIVLAFVTDWGGRPVEPTETAWRLLPSVGPDGAGLSFGASF